MKIEEPSPQLRYIAPEIFNLPAESLPTDEDLLKEAVVAEAVRLALDSSQPDESNWSTTHILSIRRWVTRKLRALIPEIASLSPESDLLREVLREGPGSNLTFLGDILELSNGYYLPAPSRLVPIQENVWALVSGLPTRYFSDIGFDVKVTGIGRRVVGSRGMLPAGIHLPIQGRESYVGLLDPVKFDSSYLESLLAGEEQRAWSPSAGWVCYQGNQGRFDFEWGSKDHKVATPLGLLSLWKAQHEYGSTEYWLRMILQGKDTMARVPTRLFKHVCLILDEWANKPRSVLVKDMKAVAIVEMPFRPPAVQARWLHAVGARWLGSLGGRIRWEISTDAIPSMVEVFDILPVVIER